MPVDTLTDLNNIITNGSGAERLAFKDIIVGGLNSQDLADIITASTRAEKEAMAVLVVEADDFLNDTNAIARAAALAAENAVAQTWFDALVTIIDNPTTRVDAIANFNVIVGLLDTETDLARLRILRLEKALANQVFKDIKAGL